MSRPVALPSGEPVDPRGPAIGYQTWHDLLLVHWRVPAEVCQRLLPDGLAVDTWDDQAWIGLVAFWMSDVRPRWFGAVPYFSRFAETNLRTYVRCGEREPGIWFFSLEAARLAAVLVARWSWGLPYHWSRMNVERQGQHVGYSARRLFDQSRAGTEIVAGVETGVPRPARPGSLEEFLVERYVFYNVDRRGRLQQGRVRHRPYPIAAAQLLSLDQSLTAAAGIDVSSPPAHVVFSPGLDVEVVGLGRVGGR